MRKDLKEEMLEAGWQTKWDFWWFEDSWAMTFADARRLHKSIGRINNAKKPIRILSMNK